ncbi:hypothetical protein D3C75_1057870 [compost metagenome]
MAEAGFSERELQKFTVLEVLPFHLGTVLDSISGLRADAADAVEAVEAVGADADAVAPELMAEPAGKSRSQGDSTLAVAAAGSGTSAAVAEALPEAGGSTLLIVLYQQDESQRAQYYTLPLN